MTLLSFLKPMLQSNRRGAFCVSALGFCASIFLSGCATTPFGLPAGTEARVGVDSDVYIEGHSNAAFRVYEGDFDVLLADKDIWLRIRNGFAMPDLEGSIVTQKENGYKKNPHYFVKSCERASRYLYYIVDEIERREMPMELALLPFLESAYNPEAVSSAKAAGMWQFIPSTGQDFSLQQDMFRDERRDVIASTNAALDYLQQLHDMFGDWHLALAAYNWGAGNVQRAIRTNARQNKPTDYLNLKMPNETKGYMPTLQALKNMVADPDTFKVTIPAIADHPFFQTVVIERDIDVDVIVKLANISHEEFKALNPAVNKPVVLAAITPQILLPWDNAGEFIRKLNSHKGKLSTWTVWQAPKTMTVAQVAVATKTSEQILREVNEIPSGVMVKQGSTLLVQHSQTNLPNVRLALLQNARVDYARSGVGRLATPSKVAVSTESQNLMLGLGHTGDNTRQTAQASQTTQIPIATVRNTNGSKIPAQ